MRKRLLSLGLVALVALSAVACGSASTASYGAQAQPPDPQHHNPTPPPARPAQTPYDAVTFPETSPNPVTDTDEDHVSTFAMDVDTASYTIARRFVADGNLPDPASIRVEEWVNAFDQAYRAPRDATFAIHLDGGPSPFLDRGDRLLRVGIKARESSERTRPDAALTFVIDTSGSMGREDRLELVKDSLRTLVLGLGHGDSIAVVTFGDDARVVLPPTRATDEETILRAIDRLQPGGSTNLEAGLRLGYSLARESILEDGIDRIVLASDGVANVGLTDGEAILRSIREDASAGIQLVAIGVGMGNYNDALLETLADQGDGFYAYVNDLAEARRLFTEDLTGTLQTVALDAKVQVEFDPDVVASFRLLGYEDRAIADHNFRDPRTDAGAIGAGHGVTALYAITLRGDAPDGRALGIVRLRWTEPDASRESSLRQEIGSSVLAADFRLTDPTFRLDAIVATAAQVLRHDPAARGTDLHDVANVAERSSDALPQTDQVHDFIEFLRQADELGG
jgi:Ca-activated chloride channel family protein